MLTYTYMLSSTFIVYKIYLCASIDALLFSSSVAVQIVSSILALQTMARDTCCSQVVLFEDCKEGLLGFLVT